MDKYRTEVISLGWTGWNLEIRKEKPKVPIRVEDLTEEQIKKAYRRHNRWLCTFLPQEPEIFPTPKYLNGRKYWGQQKEVCFICGKTKVKLLGWYTVKIVSTSF